ncbi:MAG: PAS domain S-box protein [Myxococcales bacterium]|nr:PAS domain S-box protein [Myxococcales bacterium]
MSNAADADFGALIEHLPDNIIVHRHGKIVYVNTATLDYLGYQSAEDLIGRPVREIIHAEDREGVTARLQAITDVTRPTPPREQRLIHRSGSVVTAEFISRMVEFGGEPAVLAVARDITERKQMQSRLMLTDRMASVGTLAAGVAHEINNPLAYVIANLSFVSEEVATIAHEWRNELVLANRMAELEATLRDAREGAERVRQIVRELKAFSRPDEDRRGPVDVRRVLESAINMTWNEIRHRARLIKNYGEIPQVEANESRLGQAFLNLLINAAQSIPEGKADKNTIRITTRLDGASGRVVVEVRDTGVGIAPDVLARIFDPFFTTKPLGVGTGLGLSICHGIVTGFGGEIGVESELGKGSVFRVTLLAAKSETSDVRQPALTPATGRRGAILVVDDEPMIGTAVRRALGSEHEVTAVASAREAIDEVIGGKRYDIILCDLMMPEMTGMDLHDEFSRIAPDQVDQLIFVTGGAFTARARDFLDAVPNQRIEKPFDMKSLRALIRDRLR